MLIKIPNFYSNIDNLSPIYKDFFYNNPYKEITELNALTHFHLMPISSLLNLISGITIGYGINPNLIMVILFLIGISISFISTYNIIRSYKKSLIFVGLIIASYPLLFIVTRGNYSAFFCGIGVLAFLNSLFIAKRINFFSMVLFAIAINFRPNAVILVLALPLLFGIKKSILPTIKIAITTLLIYILTYLIVNYIYPDYTFTTFLKAFSVYNKLYVVGNNGLPFNSSLYGIFQIIGILFKINIGVITGIFYVVSMFILIALVRLIFKKNIIIEYYPFILSSIYILLNPVAADYHLLIFIFPIFIISNNYDSWTDNRTAQRIITVSSLLILSPKNYLFIHDISLQVVINPLIMLITTIYLFYLIEMKNSSSNLILNSNRFLETE